MTIALGADHGGFALKNEIAAHLKERGLLFEDFGVFSTDSCDYPDIAAPLAAAVAAGTYTLGILVCGTGVGMSIAANKVSGVRAALCGDCYSAKLTRLHNDANVLCLGARVLGPGLALQIVDTFLVQSFEGGRHIQRLQKIARLEQRP